MLVVSDRSFTKGLFFVLVIVSMAVSLGAMLLVGGGPVLAKSEVQLEIERRFPPISEKPEWVKNPVAMEALDPNTVLKPWTPVEASARQVAVWNRTYEIGPWGLPTQVHIGGEEFLSGPLTFQLRLSGVEEPLEPPAVLEEAYQGVAVYVASCAEDGVRLEVQTRYEFDGFIRTDIELTAPPETQADSWELVIPFKNENALFFSAIHASSLRMESQQANSVSAAIPEGSGVVWNSDFRPLVWIGNRDAGLSWFSESREYWRPEVNPHAIRIVRHDDRVELRVSLIAQPTVLPEKMTLSFGLMATPVKPLPEGWRGWKIAAHHSTTDHLQRQGQAVRRTPKGNHLILWHDSWRIVLMYPRERDPELFRKEVAYLKSIGVDRIYPYVVASHITGRERTHIPGEDFVFTTPEWEAFKDEWEMQPNRGPEDYRRVSPASGFADFHLSAIKDWIVNAGVNGVYVDEAYPYPNTVEAHGMGYVDSLGVRQPTYHIYAMRDYLKRMAYLFQEHGDGPPAIIAHASGVLTIPFLSFVDAFVTGEQVYYSVRDWSGDGPPSYMEMTPLDQWGAEFSGRQFGFVPVFLPELRPNLNPRYPDINTDVKATREMISLALLHDVLVWPLWSDANEWNKVVFVRDEFRIGGPDVVFHPFWQTRAAKTDEPDVLVSSYVGDRGILAAVVNMSHESKTVTVDFSPIAGDTSYSLAWTTENVSFLNVSNNRVKITVPARDFLLVRMRK
jgi:hypothetical protein